MTNIKYLKKVENNNIIDVISYTPNIITKANIEKTLLNKANGIDEVVLYDIDEVNEFYISKGYIDATEEEYNNYILLPILKNQLIQEVINFFQNLRYFNIKKNDDVIMTIKAEQNLTDGVQSWINELENTEKKTYHYLKYELSLQQCKTLLGYISMVRNKCATLQTYYCGDIDKKIVGAIQLIKSYKELQTFNYKIDPDTNQIIDTNFFSPFILN